MSIKINPLKNIEFSNGREISVEKKHLKSEDVNDSLKLSVLTADNLNLFSANLRKFQLFEKLNASNGFNKIDAIATSKINLGDNDDELIKETKRLVENYKRKIEPKEIGGSQPDTGKKTPGHPDSKHGVKPDVQAEIMNNAERIFSGKNKNNRYVDIYYKDGSVVITEQGDKSKVITAYGKVATKGKAKPFNLQKTINDPNFVEIKLDKLGSTTVVYPNKEQFKTNDFPPGPPRNNNDGNPKTNGGNSTPNETTPAKSNAPGNIKLNASTVTETTVNPKPTVTSEPPVAPKSSTVIEDAPVRPNGLGKLANNMSRGLVVMQLVQLGVAALNYTQLKADAEKFGYYIDPFLDKYIISDPEKAAKNLGEGFELTFYVDPDDFYNQGKSVVFTVKDGKFTNPDGWQLVYNEEKGYTEAVLTA